MDSSSALVPQPERRPAPRDLQGRLVGYGVTSAALWGIWAVGGMPMGLPGVEVVDSTVNMGPGMFPALFMLIGLPGLVTRAWRTLSSETSPE